MKFKIIVTLFFGFLVSCFSNCSKDQAAYRYSKYKTKNVIIIIADGARYNETWGNSTREFIPYRAALLQQGVMCTEFYNNGITSTVPGHTAICTGVYQNIDNTGAEYPLNPSIFQYWLKATNNVNNKAWVIATKDKLAVLANCTNSVWKNKYLPSFDCGNAGLNTGYREDTITFIRAKSILTSDHPQLLLINFKQPDEAGHHADSLGYLKGIKDTDFYIKQLWEQIQSDESYKDQTTLIVTNDHGRHTPGHLDGFVSHGDNCNGCKHIEFFAIGPDFKQNYTSNTTHETIDIAATISELMGISIPTSNGKVMYDLFNK